MFSTYLALIRPFFYLNIGAIVKLNLKKKRPGFRSVAELQSELVQYVPTKNILNCTNDKINIAIKLTYLQNKHPLSIFQIFRFKFKN